MMILPKLEIIEFNGAVEEFMETDEFEEKIAEPARLYEFQVYLVCMTKLSDLQMEMFDDWWYSRKQIPSDECYWKNAEVPEGYGKYTPLDIKIVHDYVLWACGMGCG